MISHLWNKITTLFGWTPVSLLGKELVPETNEEATEHIDPLAEKVKSMHMGLDRLYGKSLELTDEYRTVVLFYIQHKDPFTYRRACEIHEEMREVDKMIHTEHSQLLDMLLQFHRTVPRQGIGKRHTRAQ